MKVTFWGAAGQVSGSMHLLETEGYKILIDCGLDYENGKPLIENQYFPFLPADIDLVVLTHAHIDHSGNLPTLIRMGFEGQILCTPPTADLSQLLLSDAVNLFQQKQGRKHYHKKNKPNGNSALYLQKHVIDTADKTVTVGFNKTFVINEDISLRFIPTGHLLGAAAAHFTVKENGRTKTIAFTGDIGRKNYPVLIDPQILPHADILVCEATYGGRLHSRAQSIEEVLEENIRKACIEQSGRLIIPAFSVGRTQALVYSLNKIFAKKKIQPVPVYVDSPLAVLATKVFRTHHHYVNEEAREFYQQHGDEFDFENLTYIQQLKESKQIASHFEPCIIISSAGMLEGGRIQDHIFRNISNSYASILFIGYCAPGTLGHKLLRGDPIVRIKDKDLPVFAKINKTDLFSGHADHDDILAYVSAMPEKPKHLLLVHGETKSLHALQQSLEENDYQVTIPSKGESFNF